MPRIITPKAPPIKTQGIKTKIVPFIAKSIKWQGDGRWVEPFLGSGVVALNIAPQQALLADTNKHLINLYRRIQEGLIDGMSMRKYLEREGRTLLEEGEKHYYAIRERFNKQADPFDFVFLSRSCFNGMMRFNQKGEFNVPFCRKPERFRRALITKIVNQVEWARTIMAEKDWTFVVQDWRTTVAEAKIGDMVYCDPPYVGRHTDYYNSFSDKDSDDLAIALTETSASFALSNWLENKYRRNEYIDEWFSDYSQVNVSHFYHVGPQEKLRNKMTEVIVLSECAAVAPQKNENPVLPIPKTAELVNV